MTKLLAIETATDACSIALWLDGKILQRHTVSPRQHVRIALPMVQELLTEAGLRLSQLDALVVGSGPGSFTGLRIAAGLVQGLAFGANLPVVPISTLRALAQACYHEKKASKVLVMMDARMEEVYAGQYVLDAQGFMQPAQEDRLYTQAQWSEFIEGLGAERVAWTLSDPEAYPQAQYLVELGHQEFIAGRFVSAENAQPVYLKRWEASS